MVVGGFDCGPIGLQFESALCRSTLTFPRVVHDWVNKGCLAVSVRLSILLKDPVPLIEKIGHHVPMVGFLLVSFIKNHRQRTEEFIRVYVLVLKMALDADV